MKKILIIIVVLALAFIIFFYFFSAPNDDGYENQKVTQKSNQDNYQKDKSSELEDDFFYDDEKASNDGAKQKSDEVWIIETEVDGPEDCTKLEKFDPENSVCYIECETVEECNKLEAQLDAELAKLEQEFESFSNNVKPKPFVGNVKDLEEKAEVVYAVEKGENFKIISGKENGNHKKVKKWFAAISPNKFSDTYLSRLIPYTKEKSDTMAYVAADPNNPGRWDMYVNMISMRDGEKEMLFTLIHEFMHILSLNTSQVDENVDPENCEYYIQEGCTKDGSYIKAFYNKFWKGKFTSDDPDSAMENFAKAENSFVTEYAATNPGEDIAESFASFIFKNKTQSTLVKDQKAMFFYNYPELVKIRDNIRRALKQIVRKRVTN